MSRQDNGSVKETCLISPQGCNHSAVSCLNPYEFIRKYRCQNCGGVMMCSCDRDFAERFLPHQTREGSELDTRREVAVTLGFQNMVCNSCRGLPEEPHPMAQLYGHSSKILRYYWREIYFETTKRFADWADHHGYKDTTEAARKHPNERQRIERQVIDEIKALHQTNPKYTYSEEPQSKVLAECNVKIVSLHALYEKTSDGSRKIRDSAGLYTPEEYVKRHYEQQGYEVLVTESVPFHALFGIFMWLLIQDPADPLNRVVGFGDRVAFETGGMSKQIWTPLPEDFGTPGYATRRKRAIVKHFRLLRDDLEWLFDYWLDPSADLRQYLWAYKADPIAAARKVVSTIPEADTIKILRYLIGAYWKRYLGWPDLFIWKGEEFFFAEVKSSKDKLSEGQKSWIRGNAVHMNLPFVLVKIHKRRE